MISKLFAPCASVWVFQGPDSVTDCTVRLTMYMPNGHWDDFDWAIYTK